MPFKVYGSLSELLRDAGLLEEAHVPAIMAECVANQVTPGQFLCRSGALDRNVVRAGILSLGLIREKLLPPELAQKALQVAATKGCSFEEALAAVNWDRRFFEHTQNISRLLLRDNLIPPDEHERIYDLCITSNGRIVEVLMARRVISEEVADNLLKSELPPHAVLALGSLLVQANLVPLKEVVVAVETGRCAGRRMGEVLMEEGLISEEHLMMALEMQAAANQKLIPVADAIEQLKAKTAKPKKRSKPNG